MCYESHKTKINVFLHTPGPLHFHSGLDDSVGQKGVMGPCWPHLRVFFIQTVSYVKRQNCFFHLHCCLKLPNACLCTLGGGAANVSIEAKVSDI
jgi:hypothetical protein